MDRRVFLVSATGTIISSMAQARIEPPKAKLMPTRFQIACMTLPYSQFPLARALRGIKAAGFEFVAWGTTHKEDGKQIPALAADAGLDAAKELAKLCRETIGLEPVMMFSTVYPESKDGLIVLEQRIKQAGAAKIGQVLTFGHTAGGNRALWVERLKKLAPIARDNGVLLVVKQHGGETGTGEACAAITRAVDHPNIKVNYDAGNVLDYLNKDPIADIKTCTGEVRSFCMKDHRNWPRSEDCAPGYGEIDHYRLLHPMARTGLTMPLACENVFAPLVAKPKSAEEVDALARRAREYLEVVTAGIGSME